MRIMHVMGGGDVGGAKTQIMNTVTGLNRNNDVMLISFRAGPFADEARERGIDIARDRAAQSVPRGTDHARPGRCVQARHYSLPRRAAPT